MRTTSDANPWLFPGGAVFPVVSSDLHPLKLHARGLLGRGVLTAIVLHVAIFGAWLVQRGLGAGDLPLVPLVVPERHIEIFKLPPPPPIQDQGGARATQLDPQTIAAVAGVPVPVEDFRAPPAAFLPPEDWVDRQTPIDGVDGSGADAPIVIDIPPAAAGSDPEGFVAYEEPPERISCPAPVYPEMARAAEVEGTVQLLVLVNKEGRVENARVVSGHPMLDDAALAAVRTWVFKPALQQHKPVKVWVACLIRFTLH
jgi:TonB family protein